MTRAQKDALRQLVQAGNELHNNQPSRGVVDPAWLRKEWGEAKAAAGKAFGPGWLQ